MKQLPLLLSILATVFALNGLVSADDGDINNKSMSKTIKVPIFDQPAVNNQVAEAEHTFIDFMKFYVPAQQASGAPAGDAEDGFIIYENIDEDEVERLPVAKPLISVFIYGPQFEVHDTAFAHRWFDTYAAVSLDDGVTYKKTNLSESADKSSFNIEEDHETGGEDGLPADHDILLGRGQPVGAFHASGYDTPYTAHCSECHGSALQGTAQSPSCYSCHGSIWEEETPLKLGPIITSATYRNGRTIVFGENAPPRTKVNIINGTTGDDVALARVSRRSTFVAVVRAKVPPCTVAASYEDPPQEDVQGPAVRVLDLQGDPVEQCAGLEVDVEDYPGGSYNVFHAVAGNKVLVAWPSRFCGSGQPAYSIAWDGDDSDLDEDKLDRRNAIIDLIRDGNPGLGIEGLDDFGIENDLYLVDAFKVAGSQGSVDFADEGYPQAGVVPFGCVWTARGILLPGDDPRTDTTEQSHMVWTKAERLTSGRRDPNRIEVRVVQDAGFVITWQEDPEGLRPGQGLGPGEGWSGAVAHSQTDAWYSFINWEYFDIVETVDDTLIPINVLEHNLLDSGRPQVFVPMAVPMRLSNNGKCNPYDKVTSGEGTPPIYCRPPNDPSTGDDLLSGVDFGLRNQCADTVFILTGKEGVLSEICVADSMDNFGVTNGADLPNRANTALTRPRTSLQGYYPSEDDKSAWVIVAAEESKGLGKYFFRPDGYIEEDNFGGTKDGFAEPCTEEESEEDPTCTEEIGKNQWYFSFDMGTPDTSAGIGNPYSLISNLVSQGNMLNQAEVYWETGEILGKMKGVDMQDYGDYNFDVVNTEIARRASLLVQGIGKAVASDSHLVAMPSWKQGVMRQGGPADTMVRRIVLPDGYDGTQGIDVNPYAFENMDCDVWLIAANTNPYYPGGVCAEPAINLSGVVPDTCLDDEDGGDTPCPTVDFTSSYYGIGDTNPILQGYEQGEGNKTRVLTWHQCPSDWSVIVDSDGVTPVDCGSDDRTDGFANLTDQSWYNPLDVSKGHRGFLDGDFVMFLYGWSPNWRLNAKGNDRYELYVRRSFDGGVSWTTTPADATGQVASDGVGFGGDGTVTCESYRKEETGTGDPLEPKACYEFAAGAAEHARNVTQHKSMKITTLDPRYAIAGSTRGVSITDTCTVGLFSDPTVIAGLWTCEDQSQVQNTDLRNPSRYFMVFETGDNRTVEVGEAEPLDLFYSRAESFGDDYVVWTETDTGYDSDPAAICYPSNAHDVDISDVLIGSGFCNEFDRLNRSGDTHSSEASLAANSDASKMYGVSGQWVLEDDDDYESDITEADAMARRVWWLDNYRSTDPDLIWTLPGSQNE